MVTGLWLPAGQRLPAINATGCGPWEPNPAIETGRSAFDDFYLKHLPGYDLATGNETDLIKLEHDDGTI